MIIDPPMPYWVTIFSQTCRLISLLILLPIFLIGVLDFAGYAVFRTLGLHRRRVRIQRQSNADVKIPVGRSNSRRKPRVYQNDRHRPTDRSNIPSIVKAPLLSPGTYDAETLLRQRARSLSIASAEQEAAWVASGGQEARLSTLSKDAAGALAPTSPTQSDAGDGDATEDGGYFGRAPRVGVDGALGLADTDVDESGTESGRDSPVQFRGSNRRRGLSGGLSFTPVSPDKPLTPLASNDEPLIAAAATHPESTPTQHRDSYDASVVSLSSDSPTSSSSGDRFLTRPDSHRQGNRSDAESSNMSSSWIGVEADEKDADVHPSKVDAQQAAAALGFESHSKAW